MSEIFKSMAAAGPWGVISALLLGGLLATAGATAILWRRNTELTDKLYQLGLDKVRSDEKVHGVLKSLMAQVSQLVQERLLRR